MYCKHMKMFLGALSFAIATLIGVPVFSEPHYDIHNDLVAYSAIEYQGILNKASSVESTEQVATVIIDDRTFTLAADCIFRNQFGTLVALTYFQPGMMVGYYAVNEEIITKMWQLADADLTKSQEEPQNSTPDSQETSGSTIRLEDGVWKN